MRTGRQRQRRQWDRYWLDCFDNLAEFDEAGSDIDLREAEPSPGGNDRDTLNHYIATMQVRERREAPLRAAALVAAERQAAAMESRAAEVRAALRSLQLAGAIDP